MKQAGKPVLSTGDRLQRNYNYYEEKAVIWYM